MMLNGGQFGVSREKPRRGRKAAQGEDAVEPTAIVSQPWVEPGAASLDWLRQELATWLNRHAAELPARPVLARSGDGFQYYRFEGVRRVRLYVSRGPFEVRVMARRELVDILVEFDVALRRDVRGYFCRLCQENGHDEVFRTTASLAAAHSFRPLLSWCRKNLREDRVLVIEGEHDRWSAAHIYSEKEFPSKSPRLHPGFVVERVLGRRRSRSPAPARRSRPQGESK